MRVLLQITPINYSNFVVKSNDTKYEQLNLLWKN